MNLKGGRLLVNGRKGNTAIIRGKWGREGEKGHPRLGIGKTLFC